MYKIKSNSCKNLKNQPANRPAGKPFIIIWTNNFSSFFSFFCSLRHTVVQVEKSIDQIKNAAREREKKSGKHLNKYGVFFSCAHDFNEHNQFRFFFLMSTIWKIQSENKRNERVLFFFCVCLQTKPLYIPCTRCYSTISPSQNRRFVFSFSTALPTIGRVYVCVATINKEISWKCSSSSLFPQMNKNLEKKKQITETV